VFLGVKQPGNAPLCTIETVPPLHIDADGSAISVEISVIVTFRLNNRPGSVFPAGLRL